MTFLSRETSAYEGQPFELFQFQRGNDSFFYTSADVDKIFNGNTYEAVPIKRASIKKSQDSGQSNLRIDADGTISLAQLYVGSTPSQVVSVTIFALHENEAESFVVWKGRVNSLRFQNNQAVINCETIITSFKRNGLRRLYQRNCPHRLYDSTTCRASQLSFTTNATLSLVTELTVSSSSFGAFANDYFTGGFLSWNSGNFVETSLITSHVGNTLTLRLAIPGLVAGADVIAVAGCDRTLETCRNRFNNVVNFGGFPWLPNRNPFEEDVF